MKVRKKQNKQGDNYEQQDRRITSYMINIKIYCRH